jgi:long-chain fatty acid transport protein
MSRHSVRTGITLFSLALLGGSALAGGFAVREQSAEGQGSSFAGVAAGTNGLSAMFWNPATISQHNEQGYISENNVSLILPSSEGTAAGAPVGLADSGNIGVLGIVPASYSVYGLTEEITLGMAVTAPYGLATNSDLWIGSPHGNKSEIFSINVTPSVAWKPIDGLTVAVGVQGEYFRGTFSSQSPASGTNFLFVKADDIAFGFVGGILLEPTDTLDIGIGFRSSIDHKLEGDGSFLPAAYLDDDMSARVKTPEMVTAGIRWQATEDWTFMGGVEWANWSRVKSLDISLDNAGVVLSTPENWKDSWFFSLGAEYAMTEQLTLRAGAAYELSPVPDSTRTPRLPDNDRLWLSIGAGYKVNDWLTANIAYSHVFIKDGGINLAAGGGLPALNANFEQSLNIVAASAVIDW